jgi:hypothetical protein
VKGVFTVAGGPRYVLTDLGREDLASARECQCHIKLVGLLFECPDCGTVWGHLRDLDGRGNGWTDKPR